MIDISNQIILISSKLSELDKLLRLINNNYECIVDDKYISLENGDFASVVIAREEDRSDEFDRQLSFIQE